MDFPTHEKLEIKCPTNTNVLDKSKQADIVKLILNQRVT